MDQTPSPLELIKSKRKHIDRLANQRGAAGEITALLNQGCWIARPRGKGLKILLDALRDAGINISGSSFDAIHLPIAHSLDFTDASAVKNFLPEMVFIEIKTANQSRVKSDFSGFFFALTEREIIASEILGNRHKVALFNAKTSEIQITSVPEILARAKSTNWQISIQL
ncbi:hypothetical protein KDX04_33440 [Burkholderia cenocepacia]|uniref:hypothetical protein n=1 Tax=Burkholderia cenocepacia TaxID=95486 RepID=UPI001B90B357|nr:hypothetical protein [Burkholderia cenocepacia]MBR7990747.1 hypothetical protein [Burkholderia cenocepacia]